VGLGKDKTKQRNVTKREEEEGGGEKEEDRERLTCGLICQKQTARDRDQKILRISEREKRKKKQKVCVQSPKLTNE
jgi:hypothetical protein